MKKVLIIIYYWPPSGGAGVYRWLKFVKYLPKFGWQPTVVTTEKGDYPVLDYSLEKDVPKDVKVIRTKTPTLSGLFRKKGVKSEIPYGSLEVTEYDNFLKRFAIWVRLNLVIPDARVIWNPYAWKAAEKELKTNHYDAVITSGPPNSTHLVGYKLKKKYNIKWIADFRDPWTRIAYLKVVKRWGITQRLDELLERKVIEECDGLLAAAGKIVQDFGALDKMFTLTNGYDPDDYPVTGKKLNSNQFMVSFFGLMTAGTDLSQLIRVCDLLRNKGIEDIKFHFWGKISPKVIDDVKMQDSNDCFHFHEYVSHQEMMEIVVGSDMLFLVMNNVRQGIVPLKVFEYIGSGKPILGLGPVDCEPAEIIRETGSGNMFDFTDIEDICNFIVSQYKERKQIKSEDKRRDKYSLYSITKRLSEILNQI